MKLRLDRAHEILKSWRYFDGDLARLFHDIPLTKNIAVGTALYLQYLAREIDKRGDKDGFVKVSNASLRRKSLPFLTPEQIRRVYRSLKDLNILTVRSRQFKKINSKAIICQAKRLKKKQAEVKVELVK